MSILTADFIETPAGDKLLNNGYPARPNRVLEYLTGHCDGSDVTVGSGTYTFPLVTAEQVGSTTYQVLSGSSVYYCPPPQAKKVVYRFTFSSYWISLHAINHYKFFINDVEIIQARHNRSAEYAEERYTFEWPISIGATEDPASAKFLKWDTPKNLYMTFRIYGTSNNNNLHGTRYWDGTNGNQFNIPILSIVATT